MTNPLAQSVNETSTDPLSCCVRLCCKSMYYRPDERPGKLHYSDTQMYWCSLTHDPEGPDGQSVSPLSCQGGRGCFCDRE
jgi:hypothetical protein